MAVAKVQEGNYFTLTGSLAEVVGALGDENVPAHKVITIYYNGTNITGIYYTGRRRGTPG